MSEYPVFIAYSYDPDPASASYTQLASRLRKRCDALAIPNDICDLDLTEHIQDLKRSCPRIQHENRMIWRYAPTFIKQKLIEHKKPVLYLHCDSLIVRKPAVGNFEPTMSVGFSPSRCRSREVHCAVYASTLFFRPDVVAYTFLEHWEYMCRNFNTAEGEHGFLEKIVRFTFDHYPEMKPFRFQLGSECKSDNPDILFGQALTKTGEIV